MKSAGVDFYPLGGDPRVLAGCKRFMACKFFNFMFEHNLFCSLINVMNKETAPVVLCRRYTHLEQENDHSYKPIGPICKVVDCIGTIYVVGS